MSIVSDTYTFVLTEPDLMAIDYRSSRLTAVGPLEVNERIWLGREGVPLLVLALRQCLSREQAPPISIAAGSDSLSVYESGHEANPYINIENRRPPGEAHPGFAWFAMSSRLANQMLVELEALVASMVITH